MISICGFEGMFLQYSSIAQSVEHAAVNRAVVGSSPTRGAFSYYPMNLMTGNTTRLTEACKYGSIYLRPHGQAVKTSPFHGGNTSSNLVGVI